MSLHPNDPSTCGPLHCYSFSAAAFCCCRSGLRARIRLPFAAVKLGAHGITGEAPPPDTEAEPEPEAEG